MTISFIIGGAIGAAVGTCVGVYLCEHKIVTVDHLKTGGSKAAAVTKAKVEDIWAKSQARKRASA